MNNKFKLYETHMPLTGDDTDAVPIVISDDKDYLLNYLNDMEIKYATTSGYFSSTTDKLLLPNELGNLKIILIKPSKKKRFLIVLNLQKLIYLIQ